MNKRIFFALLILSVMAGLIYSNVSFAQNKALPGKSLLDNLQIAYSEEANSHANYMAYAEKADKEGYGRVASLFRAAAKSDELQMNGHAKIIKALKAEPKADIKKPMMMTTKGNLEMCIKEEKEEVESMYPEFIKKAKEEKNTGAMKSFMGAQKADEMHVKYMKDALSNLNKWKAGQKEFLVCTVCSYLTDDLKVMKCPVCSSPRDKFVSVK